MKEIIKSIMVGICVIITAISVPVGLGTLTSMAVRDIKAQTPTELSTYWLMPVFEEPWTVEVYRQDILGWRLDAYRADVCIDPNQPYFWCYIDKKTMLKINVKIRQVNYTDFAKVAK